MGERIWEEEVAAVRAASWTSEPAKVEGFDARRVAFRTLEVNVVHDDWLDWLIVLAGGDRVSSRREEAPSMRGRWIRWWIG